MTVDEVLAATAAVVYAAGEHAGQRELSMLLTRVITDAADGDPVLATAARARLTARLGQAPTAWVLAGATCDDLARVCADLSHPCLDLTGSSC